MGSQHPQDGIPNQFERCNLITGYQIYSQNHQNLQMKPCNNKSKTKMNYFLYIGSKSILLAASIGKWTHSMCFIK